MPVECESQRGGRVGRTLARTHAHAHLLTPTHTQATHSCNEHAKRTAGLEGRELLGVANCWR